MAENSNDWFCVRTNIKCERRARDGLLALGLDVYLPERMKTSKPRHLRGKRVQSLVPLMPPYLFISDPGPTGFFDIRGTNGVESVVGIHGRPIKVPAKEVERFQELQALGAFDEDGREKFEPGQAFYFQLENGLGDLLVTLEQDTGGDEVIVLSEIFNRPTKVRVSIDKLTRAA